jgi:hypothetical protein
MMVYVLLLNSAGTVWAGKINLGHSMKGRHHGKGSTGFIGSQIQVAASSRSLQAPTERYACPEAIIGALLRRKRRTGAANRRIATEKE